MENKVKVVAKKRFFLGGKNVGPGEIEVPAGKVERLVAKGLVEGPTAEPESSSEEPEGSEPKSKRKSK